jgi:hypothetical protein
LIRAIPSEKRARAPQAQISKAFCTHISHQCLTFLAVYRHWKTQHGAHAIIAKSHTKSEAGQITEKGEEAEEHSNEKERPSQA